MKNLFPGYNKKSEAELEQLWSDCIFVFDANVLLGLYRYTDATKDSILNLISSFHDRVWLPHQAALEFNTHRYEIIAEQIKLYKKHETEISKTLDDLKSNKRPPFFSASTITSLENGINELKKEVNDTVIKFENYYKYDPIYEKVVSLFDEGITSTFTLERLNEIYKEGENRYKEMVPPGFEDAKEKNDNRKYGDLVIWFQMIDLASKLDRNIIFITDDQKIDWYWKLSDGKTMGPRHELVAEMKEEADVDFHIYTSDGFLKFGQDFLNEDINSEASNEIKALNERAWQDGPNDIITITDLFGRERLLNVHSNYDETTLRTKQATDQLISELGSKLESLSRGGLEEGDESLDDLRLRLESLRSIQNELRKSLRKRNNEEKERQYLEYIKFKSGDNSEQSKL